MNASTEFYDFGTYNLHKATNEKRKLCHFMSTLARHRALQS